MKTIHLFVIFVTFASSMCVANPHPYLLQSAREGRWNDFKNFLYEHPEEAEDCDDSIFALATAADRMDVFDGSPAPSAPQLELEDRPISNHPPAPSAPWLCPEEQQEQEDLKIARFLQQQEYAAPEEYEYVEDRQERHSRRVCSLNSMICSAAAAFGAYVIWNLLDVSL